MKLLKLLIWLQIRLTVNRCRTMMGALDRIFAVLTMVTLTAGALLLGIPAFFFGMNITEEGYLMLHFLMAVPYVAWLVGPQVGKKLAGSDFFALKRLVPLPVSLRRLAIWNLLATLFAPCVIGFVPAFVCFAVGIAIQVPVQGLLVMVSLMLYTVFGAVFYRLNGTLSLLKSGWLMGFIKILGGMLLVVSCPFLWVSFGLTLGMEGKILWWLLSLLALTTLIVFLTFLQLRFSVQIVGQPDSKGPPPRRSTGTGLLDSKLDPMVGREVIALRRRYMLLIPMIITILGVAVFVVISVVQGKMIVIPSQAWCGMLLGLGGLNCCIWGTSAINTWAHDGSGVRSFFTLPYLVPTLYRRKAFAGLLLFTVWYLSTLAVSFITCRPGIIDVINVTLVIYASKIYIWGIGSLTSAWFPHPPSTNVKREGGERYLASWVISLLIMPYMLLMIGVAVLVCMEGPTKLIGGGLALGTLLFSVVILWYCPVLAARSKNGTPELICQELHLAK